MVSQCVYGRCLCTCKDSLRVVCAVEPPFKAFTRNRAHSVLFWVETVLLLFRCVSIHASVESLGTRGPCVRGVTGRGCKSLEAYSTYYALVGFALVYSTVSKATFTVSRVTLLWGSCVPGNVYLHFGSPQSPYLLC